MKKEEIDKLSLEELQESLDRLKKEYVKLKSSHMITPLENPLRLRTLRRSIARIITMINANSNVK